MNVYPHWDLWSLIIYLIMGIISAVSLFLVKKKEKLENRKQSIFSLPYIVWFLSWTILTAFRHVEPYIGRYRCHGICEFF